MIELTWRSIVLGGLEVVLGVLICVGFCCVGSRVGLGLVLLIKWVG